VPGVTDYSIGIEITIKVVLSAAGAAPAEQTDEKEGSQTGKTANDAADDCAGVTAAAAAAASRTGGHSRRDEDGGMNGSGDYLTIGSSRAGNKSRCATLKIMATYTITEV